VKISGIRLTRSSGSARAEARVTWEDSPRPPFDLYFETDERGGDHLVGSPEAFLVACLIPAAHAGQRRILIEGALCPRLAEGAAASLALFRKWWGPSWAPIAIEAAEGFRVLTPRTPARSAFFLTGGVDSLHLLGTNRARYPLGHPESFVDCLSVYGHLCAESEDSPWNDRALLELEGTAARAGLTLIFVRSNLWKLEPDLPMVADQSLSSAIASAAHLFPGRWSQVTIASGRDIGREIPRGTHPMLDPLYSSSAVEIRHPASPYTRFDRLRAIAGFRPGLESLIVCLAYPDPPYLNCGRCEKCVRTMTCLYALGLQGARHFPPWEIRPEMIRAVAMGPNDASYWIDALPALAAKGRNDLVRAIEEKLDQVRRDEAWHRDAGWKGRLRRLDRRLFGGKMTDLRRRLSRE
jgi:hypothetical protein